MGFEAEKDRESAMTSDYVSVAELIFQLQQIDQQLPIKIVVVDSEGDPYCDAVLKRETSSIARKTVARIAEGSCRDVLLVRCLGLYD